LRLAQPDQPRPFRCPWGKTVAVAGALPATSWWRLGLWLLTGLAVYFLYAYRCGRFREVEARGDED
jgi:APA family basic amino acid/polyamine antiporter